MEEEGLWEDFPENREGGWPSVGGAFRLSQETGHCGIGSHGYGTADSGRSRNRIGTGVASGSWLDQVSDAFLGTDVDDALELENYYATGASCQAVGHAAPSVVFPARFPMACVGLRYVWSGSPC